MDGKTIRQRIEAYELAQWIRPSGVNLNLPQNTKKQVDSILRGDSNYQRACAIHYDAVQQTELSTGKVTSPSQWYLESCA